MGTESSLEERQRHDAEIAANNKARQERQAQFEADSTPSGGSQNLEQVLTVGSDPGGKAITGPVEIAPDTDMVSSPFVVIVPNDFEWDNAPLRVQLEDGSVLFQMSGGGALETGSGIPLKVKSRINGANVVLDNESNVEDHYLSLTMRNGQNTNPVRVETAQNEALFEIDFNGGIGFFGRPPTNAPALASTPTTLQGVIDALVAYGFLKAPT